MRLRVLLVFIWIVCVAGCTPVPARTSAATARHPLILVSIDGFRADYLDRHETPTLAAIAADGVRAEAMKPAFPTLPFRTTTRW
jgi:predicted AlkP superfamily pyrophosphatase or phosphodiesterase